MPSVLNSVGFQPTRRPSIYARVDASALAGGALTSGNLAIVGDFPTFKSESVELFSSRRSMVDYDPEDQELSMMAQIAFSPSDDPAVNAGAASVRIVNARSSCVASTFTIGAITCTSKIFGPRSNSTRSTLTINGDDLKLVIDRGGRSETYQAVNRDLATITNNKNADVDFTSSDGVITVESGGSTLLSITQNEAPDLRAAITLINQLEDISAVLIEPGSIPLSELDYQTHTIAQGGGAYTVKAPNQALFSEIRSSKLVSSTINTTSSALALAASTIYASGGAQGAGHDYASALRALEAENVQVLVFFELMEGRQALIKDHLKAAAQAGYERQVYTGIEQSSTLAQVRERAAKLNAPEIALASQDIRLFDARGVIVEKDARFTALLFAAMQAGSDTGEPLTRKRPRVVSFKQSWDTHNDAEQALQSGSIFLSQGPLGPRVERSITTHLTDDNPILSEVSAYESVLSSLRDLRVALADQLGRPTKPSQMSLIEARVNARLTSQVRDGLIKNFENVTLEDLGDQVAVSYDLAPLEPLNFITITAITRRF